MDAHRNGEGEMVGEKMRATAGGKKWERERVRRREGKKRVSVRVGIKRDEHM